MLSNQVDFSTRRKHLKSRLKSGKLLRFPGAISPLVGMLIEQMEFDGVYVSGAVMANDLGLPDIGLTTLTEVAGRGHAIARSQNLPTIIDADTGFGETMNVARTIQTLEHAGLSGCHLEDQIAPKRCGHLDHKSLVTTDQMTQKIRAAVDARHDSNFLVIARTDARANEGLDQAINRAKAYADAGADMIFPEALTEIHEFEQFRNALDVPLLANMTEFGKSPLLTYEQLNNIGFNMVIYPVTCQRLAMHAIRDGLSHILTHGSQHDLLPKMQSRADLYDLLKYKEYEQFDQSVFNFTLEGKSS